MFLYNVFILPIIFLLEILIHFLSPVLNYNPVLAILIVSFIVNFITYPIFKKIEIMCQHDNDKYNSLLPKIKSIKTNFVGPEQRMILNTYFKQNNYHPLLAHFKQSLTLLLQVPFFIASYIVISNNYLFQSDVITAINEAIKTSIIPIRILPILMTVINIISVNIYMKNKTVATKLYSFSLAFIFFVLLYFSPASVVMYWLFNNSFSLLRNVWFYRKKQVWVYASVLIFSISTLVFVANNSASWLYVLQAVFIFSILYISYKLLIIINKKPFYVLCFLEFCIIYFVMYALDLERQRDPLLRFVIIVFFIEALIYVKKYILDKTKYELTFTDFSICTLLNFVVFGVYLPLKIINSDFNQFYAVITPDNLIKYEMLLGAGVFIVYPSLIYLFIKNMRKSFYFVTIFFIFYSFFQLCTFSLPKDVLIASMKFEITNNIEYTDVDVFKDLLVGLIIFFVCLLFIRFNLLKYLNIVFFSCLIVYVYMTGVEFFRLNSYKNNITQQKNTDWTIQFNQKQKNVLILFMDKAVSGFLPYILEEVPHLKEDFDGFVYYPYMVSYSPHTLYSTPSLLGGYEYIPQKMQNDTKRNIVDKHNESISVLPEIFRTNGFDVTLIDIPDINYGDPDKENIYHKDIKYINSNGVFIDREENYMDLIKRNIFFFTLFRIAPTLFKNDIYDNGLYMQRSVTKAAYLYKTCFNLIINYKVFKKFISNITSINNSSKGSFVIMHSLLSHARGLITDNYEITNDINKTKKTSRYFNQERTIQDYNVNMLTYQLLAKLFKVLKDKNIYDNTKIIIMSDHADYYTDIPHVDPKISQNHAILLYKDFNDRGKIRISSNLMTGADISTLAVDNIIDNPLNPFTCKQLSSDEKSKGVDIIKTLFRKRDPRQFSTNDRTYLYDENVEYLHIDENNIKDFIKIEGALGKL